MMEKFRNLAHNIFFKIFLGFLGLTFIMFGVSGFILGGNNVWIAKVGGKTIPYDKFLQATQNDREAIYRSNPKKEVLEYLNSDQFKQDVLGRMITLSLVESLQQEFQIFPSKDLILREIVQNDSLKGPDGKFSRTLYQNFLKINSLSEKQHITNLSDEIVGSLIVQSFTDLPQAEKQLAADLYQHRFQTREADLVTISMKNIGKSENPNDFELNGFFEKHKNQFDLPELRKVSYIVFGDNYLKPSIKISDDEVALEYESNKDEYTTPETADFYQILFSDESEAKNFYQELKDQTEVLDANKAEIFIKLASSKGKDRSSINLDKISKKLLPKEVANPAFDLSKGQFSDVIESQIGFHVFYLVNKNPASLSPFREVRDEIKKRLLAQKEENQVQNGLRNISNEILATNSLEKVSQTLKMSIDKSLPKFAINGLDSRQKPISDLQDLTDFAKNSFDLEQGKVSKIFASKNGKYYIILVEKIDQKRQRSLDEVRVAVTDMWIKQVKQEKMTDFANKISQEINKEGSNLLKIIAKNGLRIEKNQQFPRFYLIDSGNGKKIPYANELLNEIFALKINQATNPIKSGKDKVVIAVLRSIQSPEKNELETESIASDMTNDLRNDILTSFNQYVQNKFPVEVNEKLMPTEDNKSSDDK